MLADKPFGEWNRFRIRQIGARTTVYLNDKLVVDHAIMENYWDRKTPVVPQGRSSCRRTAAKSAGATSSSARFRPKRPTDCCSGDDGGLRVGLQRTDLTGWQGAVDNYEVVDGAIRCKPDKGGTLYTKEEYADFVVRLEFKLPTGRQQRPGHPLPRPGGSRLRRHVRTAGARHPRLSRPTRSSPGARLRLRHGRRPRGYLRPVGQWNYQEVTVQGSTIKVELNGTVILDADLSEVKEFMANHAAPGPQDAARLFRLRRPQRSGGVPQHPDQTAERLDVQGPYYARFAGKTFVIHAEDEAVENAATMREILRGMQQLRQHGIRVLFVFGKGTQFAGELKRDFGVVPHPETNRLIIPESALPRIAQERTRIIHAVESVCEAEAIPICVVPRSAIRVERRIGHGSTGVPAYFDLQDMRTALEREQIAVTGFGGEDDVHRFLHVPSVSLAADLAVALDAQKLLFLMHADGIQIPHPKRGTRQLSFADLEELLCLLQRQDHGCEFILSGALLPKVHASIRAVAGGVNQVHLVSYMRLLDEVLTRTGVGTMIECRQSHHVDYARPDDLDEIERLHAESQQFRSPYGTPYVAPLERSQLARLLPQTLLLQHREVVIGKLHTVPLPGDPDGLQIGGFVIAENHQDSQQGQLLLTEAFARLREQGYTRAVAISASQRAQGLFRRIGGTTSLAQNCSSPAAQKSLQRYVPEERDQVEWIEFRL